VKIEANSFANTTEEWLTLSLELMEKIKSASQI
jgi:hypothetical protein